MLINARTDTKWWHSYVTKASVIVFLKGRVKFLHGDNGKPVNSSTAPSCIVVFDGDGINATPLVYHWDWRSQDADHFRSRRREIEKYMQFFRMGRG